jgi:hypothetical protein
MRWAVLTSLAAGAVAGCAADPPPPARHVSSAETSRAAMREPMAKPELAELPPLAQAGSADTSRTHQGMLVARATLDATMPPAPEDRSYATLQAWVDSEVVTWVERRRSQTQDTRDRFELEGELNSSERAVSHATIGLIHEDTAFALRGIPAPSELDSEPEIAQMYLEIVGAQAATFLRSALAEFRDCANEAYRSPEDMRGFAEFCRVRYDRLQRVLTPPLPATASQ